MKLHKLTIIALSIWFINLIASIKLGSFKPYFWVMVLFNLWLIYESIFNQ